MDDFCRRAAVAAALLTLVLPACCRAQAPAPARPEPMSVRQIAEAALPSVVTIVIDDSSGQTSGLGSGFVVAQDAVVTNIHVIAGAGWVNVNFPDGRSVQARGVIAADPERDLAVIRVETGKVAPLPLADPADVHVGDQTVALGSPLGLTESVSSGIVSALRLQDHEQIVQTTAPISHGSSGGPLLDDNGEVIGVDSMILPDGENLNFAVSSQYIGPLLAHPSPALLPWSTFQSQPGDDGGDTKPPADGPATKPTGPGHETAQGDSGGDGDRAKPPPPPPPPPGSHEPMVWVNTNTGIYHMPGSRYYGKTHAGQYMTESQARAKGYRRAAREK
ncbi:MAG: S1C family serine protease [Capsulimonadaceae bacterium]